jgi:hypothetical protein
LVSKTTGSIHQQASLNISGFSFSPDKSIELVFEYPPAAADFLGLDFTCGYILEVSRAGNLDIKAGLLRVKNYVIVHGVLAGIRPSIITVAPVRCFAAIPAPVMLQLTFFYHESDLEYLNKIRGTESLLIIGI